MGDAPATGVGIRLGEVVASIATRALAALAAGVLVLGFGGRLVMYLSRLLHPGALGALTEGGNRVGDFTVGGTVGLVFFGGLFNGLLVALVWVVVEPWIPKRPVAVGTAAAMIGSFSLIVSENIDFVVLRDPYFDVVLLIGLVFAMGVALVYFDRWLEGRLPDPADSTGWKVTSWVIVALGATVFFGPLRVFFSEDFCFCEEPPVATGVLLVIVGLATLWSWVNRVRGEANPPALDRWAPIAVWAAVVAGAIHLGREIVQIFV